jgi:hypothetical protein
MIKRLITHPAREPDKNWLDESAIALVELTSEHPDHPIEQALQAGGGRQLASWMCWAPDDTARVQRSSKRAEDPVEFSGQGVADAGILAFLG